MKKLCFVLALICFVTGVAKSQNWSTLSGPQVASNVRDISVTTSGSYLYIADNGHVLKSTNSGDGWAVTSSPSENPLFVLVRPSHENTVLAAKNNELVYSSNGGASWTAITGLTDLTPLRLIAGSISNDMMYMGRTKVSGNNAVWKSTDGGQTWGKVTTFGAEANVHDFASYPTSGQGRNGVVLAGGIRPGGASPEGSSHSSPAVTSGLWKSVDDGANWDQNGLGDCNVRSVAIVPKASGTDYIRLAVSVKSGNDELMRNTSLTDDNAWGAVTLPDPVPADIYLVRRMGNGYIFLATSNGVWRTTNTTNDGTSWSRVGFAGTDVISVAVSPSGDNVFAGTATTLYKSTNNGSTWSNVGDMNVSSVEAAEISATQYSWAVTKDNNIAARYTGSWARKTIGDEGIQFSTESIYRTHPNGPLFAAGALGTTARLYSSTNNGDGFNQETSANILESGSRYHGIVDGPASGTKYLFGGGTMASPHSGWKNVFKTTNDGASWTGIAEVGATNVWIYSLVAPTGLIVYAAASNGNVYKSTDGGSTWGNTVSVGNVARSIAVNPTHNAAVVYAGGSGGGSSGLWKTTDSGSSWNQVGSGIISNVLKVMMHPTYLGSSDYVWVVSSNGDKVYKTTNGGSNWNEISGVPTTTKITTLGDDGVNKGYSYLGTEDGAYRINELPAAPVNFAGSIVSGFPHLTWDSNVESDLKASPYEVWRYYRTCTTSYCPNKSCGDEAGTGNAAIATTSNTYYDDPTTPVANCGTVGIGLGLVGYYVKAIDNADQASAESARKLYNKGTGDVEKGVVPDEVPDEFYHAANYPNPFNPVTTIKYALPEDVPVSLVVVDMLGRQISVLVNEKQTAGYKSVEFDASSLASGMYLYKLVAGTFTDVKKMVVAK